MGRFVAGTIVEVEKARRRGCMEVVAEGNKRYDFLYSTYSCVKVRSLGEARRFPRHGWPRLGSTIVAELDERGSITSWAYFDDASHLLKSDESVKVSGGSQIHSDEAPADASRLRGSTLSTDLTLAHLWGANGMPKRPKFVMDLSDEQIAVLVGGQVRNTRRDHEEYRKNLGRQFQQ